MRRKKLPPLDTLVFFEAAVKAGSFSAAAKDLYVSQAAVSKRIIQLEEWLGVTLFDRGARSLKLTIAGETLAEPVTMAFDYLQSALNSVKTPIDPSIRIAANSAVAVFWLFKRLKSFAISPAACPIETVVKDDDMALLTSDNDLAIVYTDEVPDGWSGRLLFEEELAPVSSPRIAKAINQGQNQIALLEYQRRAPSWINWDVWLSKDPLRPFQNNPKTICQSYSNSIGRALAGEGIALASCALLSEEISNGDLHLLTKYPTKTGKGYYLVWKSSNTKRQITSLIDFLIMGENITDKTL